MPDDTLSVTADLRDIGGPSVLTLKDDGDLMDSTAGDDTYTGSFIPEMVMASTVLEIDIDVVDGEGLTDTEVVTIELVLDIDVKIDLPREVNIGESFLIEVRVDPRDEETEVIADPDGVTEFGPRNLNDAGIDGDMVAGDGTYTTRVSFSEGTDISSIVIEVIDDEGSLLWRGSERIFVKESIDGGGEPHVLTYLIITLVVAVIVASVAGAVIAVIRRGRTDKVQFRKESPKHLKKKDPEITRYKDRTDVEFDPEKTVAALVID